MAAIGMTDSQRLAIKNNLKDLQDRIDANALINYVYVRGGFDYSKQEELLAPTVTSTRAKGFLNAIQNIENGWKLLEDGLKEAKQGFLFRMLFKAEQEARIEIKEKKEFEKMKVRRTSRFQFA